MAQVDVVSNSQFWGALGAALTVGVGLIVWLVKYFVRRESDVSNKFYTYLESQIVEARIERGEYVKTIRQLAGAIEDANTNSQKFYDKMSKAQDEITKTLQSVGATVVDMAKRADIHVKPPKSEQSKT